MGELKRFRVERLENTPKSNNRPYKKRNLLR